VDYYLQTVRPATTAARLMGSISANTPVPGRSTKTGRCYPFTAERCSDPGFPRICFEGPDAAFAEKSRLGFPSARMYSRAIQPFLEGGVHAPFQQDGLPGFSGFRRREKFLHIARPDLLDVRVSPTHETSRVDHLRDDGRPVSLRALSRIFSLSVPVPGTNRGGPRFEGAPPSMVAPKPSRPRPFVSFDPRSNAQVPRMTVKSCPSRTPPATTIVLAQCSFAPQAANSS
jgi:hypothetical protein